MKRIFIYLLGIIFLLIVSAAVFCDYNKEKKTTLEKVTVAEVAHTIFYAPMYVAIENKYFEKHGLKIDLFLANGADKVTAAVLSGDADIGFCGSEATIYVYNAKEKDYLKTFSQLTQKDGSFIVSRKKIDNFTLNDLVGKDIIGGRAAGMPEMTLEYVLKKHGINPREDVNIDTSIAFAAMSGAFLGGQGDFVTLFEPTASMIEKENKGYVVASVGQLGGIVPYTSFSARISYLENNPKIIKSFNLAIQEGIDYVHNHTDKEVALAISKQFPDTKISDIKQAVKRYRDIDSWPKTTKFSKESFEHLQDIMIDYGEINNKVPYEKLFYNIK